MGSFSIDEEEGCFGCGEVWGYMVAGEYLVDVLAHVVLVILTKFLESGFEVFMEYLLVFHCFGDDKGRKDVIAKLH